jgi:hypothetical protein|tara:strand:- start:689 stop:1273 length:585 start_codon:yes stop_codon:yes gene_type:complete
MSRLVFRSPDTSPVTVETSSVTVNHHILLEATVRPIGTGDYNKEKVEAQALSLKKLRTDGKDLFEMNETRRVQSAGTLLYQSTETYGTSMSIEKIVETLKESDLTLRVNFNRPGIHSNTTCMELSHETLEKLINTNADAHGNKVAELRVKAEHSASVPRHGAIFVAITKKGNQHYLSHVDYKIMASYDAMYHEN